MSFISIFRRTGTRYSKMSRLIAGFIFCDIINSKAQINDEDHSFINLRQHGFIIMSPLLWTFVACFLLSSTLADEAAVQGGLRARRKTQENRCGCADCSESVWSRDARDPVTLVSYTCGERIEYLIEQGTSEIDACRLVAGEEFATVCGRECNPNRCDGRYFVPNVSGPATAEVNTVTNLTPQYCFPDPESRATWDNVWGKYTVQGKNKNYS